MTLLVDHGRYEELVQLFTEDCEFTRPGVDLRGRAELLGFLPGACMTFQPDKPAKAKRLSDFRDIHRLR